MIDFVDEIYAECKPQTQEGKYLIDPLYQIYATCDDTLEGEYQ